ncbi:MAG: DUF58 domain-containing protein [Peptococcaceae bacterium]|nr:DUF58 domain-containing protein [Peptococcaceae bacterium]
MKVETKVNLSRLFPDDKINFSLICQNEKRLPVYLSWQLPLDQEFRLLDRDETFSGGIRGKVYLGPYQSKEYNYCLTAQKRGYYQIPALKLYSRDIWGLFNREKTIEHNQHIIVYPRLLPLEEVSMKAADFSGLQQDKRPFLFDPIMFAGLRDYTPDMPTRLIHWKASAYQDRLLAKIIEPSASLQVLIAIDAQSFIYPDSDEVLFEKALSVAATLAVWADSHKIPFGLAANLSQKGQPGPISLPVNRNLDQGRLVLEALARAELAPLGKLEDILQDKALSMLWGVTLIIIKKDPNPIALASRFGQVILYPLLEAGDDL